MNARPVAFATALVSAATVAMLFTLGCGGGSSPVPTAPSLAPSPPAASPPAPPAPPATVRLTGRVLAGSAGFPVRGATLTALDGVNSGRTAMTDSMGAYQFANLQPAPTNFSANAAGCREERRSASVDGAGSLDFTLQCETVPVLFSPANGAILDNGCMVAFATEPAIWDFDWSDVPGATAYHLWVKLPSSRAALIDNQNIPNSEYQRNERGYIIESNARGWEWRVRARLGDTFGEWSVTRSFDIEREGTDCQPTITSVSPPDVTTGTHTVTLDGAHLIPGTLTLTSPTGRRSTSNAPQVLLNGRYVIQSTVTLGEPGTWTLRLTTVRMEQSNAVSLTVR
jgi:carboxypeptidase family protein